MSDKAGAPLRARLAEVEARELRRRIDPLLRELEAAARQIRAGVREVERAAGAARRSRWEKPLVMFALGALVTALALSVAPGDWILSESRRRQQALGQRLEIVWTTLKPEERNQLGALLGLAVAAEGQD